MTQVITPLRQRMIDDMRMRKLFLSIQSAYIRVAQANLQLDFPRFPPSRPVQRRSGALPRVMPRPVIADRHRTTLTEADHELSGSPFRLGQADNHHDKNRCSFIAF
jgi:hypothetical protein